MLPLSRNATKEDIKAILQQTEEGIGLLSFRDLIQVDYNTLTALAQDILWATDQKPVYVCLPGDFAKALGQKMALSDPKRPILCIDRVDAAEGQYLDIGKPVSAALPVVIKTLVLEHGGTL